MAHTRIRGRELSWWSEAIPDVLRLETIAGFSGWQLSRLIHPALPTHSYRTYHPKYLALAALFDQTIGAIVAQVEG